MKKIISESSIWDLHIHTPLCPKSSNNYNGDDYKKFCSELLKEMMKNQDLKMISFTDHNKINVNVYAEMRKLLSDNKIDVSLITGVEMDLKINSKDTKAKHIIFYFDDSHIISDISDTISDFINENGIMFDVFVERLYEKKFRFAISPHAFKQNARGIDREFIVEDEEWINKGLYADYFFTFWESTKSNLVQAKRFISEYYSDDSTAITIFSDSKSYEQFANRLKEPLQYFYSMNNFRGILLAGSDNTRITKEKIVPKNNKSENIGEICFDGSPIKFSDRLNAIIGGRGQGKSALLERMAIYFEQDEGVRPQKKRFLEKFSLQISNFDSKPMPSNLKVKFLSQSYINDLFDDESTRKIKEYFNSEFSNITIPSESDRNLKLRSLSSFQNYTDINVEELNMFDVYKNVKKSIEGKFSFDLDIEESNFITIIDKESYYKRINDIIPNMITNDQIIYHKRQLVIEIVKFIIKSNVEEFNSKIVNQVFSDIITKQNESSDSQLELKNIGLTKLKSHLEKSYINVVSKMKLINWYYSIRSDESDLIIKSVEKNGDGDNKFYFLKYSNCEHPIEYIKRVLIESIDGTRHRNKNTISNFELFKSYSLNQLKYKDSIDSKEIENKMLSLEDLKCINKAAIIHFEDGKFIDLYTSSPGVQTNSLMEYILFQNSSIPLLIDQPEDNIDNEARYSKLTKWIKKQKDKRQIIIVTHDANLVINGDSENIIISTKDSDSFKYSYGALEYKNNLEKAATILDGGKIAVKRRIVKYGE